MFDDPHKRTFFNAPQSVTTFVAALLEPGITVLTFIVAMAAFDPHLQATDRRLTLCMLVLALTFPGRNRFRDSLLGAAVDIVSSWLVLLGILVLCAFATDSLEYFERGGLPGGEGESHPADLGLATPVLQWLATWIGRTALLRHAERRRPGARRWWSAPAPSAPRSPARCRKAETRRRVRRLLRRPPRRPHRPRGPGAGPGQARPSRRLRRQARRARRLHHPAARLAAAHRRPARAAAGDDGVAVLRARRVRHQHHPGPAAGHERRSGGRHLRDALHRHQRAGEAGERPGAGDADPGADLAADAVHRLRRQAQLARPGDLPAAPQRPRRRRDRGLQVPLDDDRRTTARRSARRRATIRG